MSIIEPFSHYKRTAIQISYHIIICIFFSLQIDSICRAGKKKHRWETKMRRVILKGGGRRSKKAKDKKIKYDMVVGGSVAALNHMHGKWTALLW